MPLAPGVLDHYTEHDFIVYLDGDLRGLTRGTLQTAHEKAGPRPSPVR